MSWPTNPPSRLTQPPNVARGPRSPNPHPDPDSDRPQKAPRQQTFGKYLESQLASEGGDVVGSGIVLDLGVEGAGRLVERRIEGGSGNGKGKGRAKWDWEWMKQNVEGARLYSDSGSTLLFPPTIKRSIPLATTLPGSSSSQPFNNSTRRARSQSVSNQQSGSSVHRPWNNKPISLSGTGVPDDILMDETIQSIIAQETGSRTRTSLSSGINSSADGLGPVRITKLRRKSSLHRSVSATDLPSSSNAFPTTSSSILQRTDLDHDSTTSPSPLPSRNRNNSYSVPTSKPTTRSGTILTHHILRREKEEKELEEGNKGKLVIVKFESWPRVRMGAGMGMGMDGDGERKEVAMFVGFPMGENGEELNVSFFETWPEGSKKVPRFTPTSKAAMRFPTPILQIVASNARSARNASRYMAIRLQSSIRILSLSLPTSFKPYAAHSQSRIHPPNSLIPIVTEIDVISMDKTRSGNRYVDVALHPFKQGVGSLVDSEGEVWIWEKGWERDNVHGSKRIGKLRNIRSRNEDDDDDDSDGFWRVAWGAIDGTVLVAGTSFIEIIDIRDHTYPARRILDLSRTEYVILSIDPHSLLRGATYTCITTSQTVAWLDETASNANPVLSWNHHRSNVTDASAVVVDLAAASVSLLFTSTWPSISCYTISGSNAAITSAQNPYFLSSPLGGKGQETDSAVVLGVPGWIENGKLLLVLGKDGELRGSVLSDVDRSGGGRSRGIEIKWSSGIEAVVVGQISGSRDDDDEGLDFRAFWADLQTAIYGDAERALDMDTVRQLLAESEDLPQDGPMTLSDIVAHACDSSERKDYASAWLRGYSIADSDISTGATTQSMDLLDKLVIKLEPDVYQLDDTLRSVCGIDMADLIAELDRESDIASFRSGLAAKDDKIARRLVQLRTSFARRKVVMDLRMASIVLGSDRAPPRRNRRSDSSEDLVEIAGRLRLDQGQAFGFKHLNPKAVWKGARDLPDFEATELVTAILDKNKGQSTIQFLLSKWEVGSDPSDLVWHPPVTLEGNGVATDEPSRPARDWLRSVQSQPDPTGFVNSAAQSQPNSNSLAVASAGRGGMSLPQIPLRQGPANLQAMGSMAMDMPSTQGVPGRFGSRTGAGATGGGKQLAGRKRAFGF